jgi:hypothetical protein
MLRAGFEPPVPVFEWEKTFRAATAKGLLTFYTMAKLVLGTK